MNDKTKAEFFARHALSAANLFIIAAFFLCAQTTLRAQTVNATLTGTTTDQNDSVLPGVVVRITNTATGFQREVQSNDNGTFIFPALPPATYTVNASKDGFAPAEINDLTLNVNDNRSLRLEMRVGAVGETVTVTDEPGLVDNSPAQSTVIDRTFVANLPLNGRSFQSLILLTPGVVPVASDDQSAGQFSVNGQRANANYFTVDGVSANVASNATAGSQSILTGQQSNGSVPGLSATGTTSNLVPVDALEEFRIQTSTYAAEFGRQPGGQVQLVTRSGGSDYHGSVFDYVRNEKFDANNFFLNARGIKKPPLRQNQFGGTFSGPVRLPRFGEGGPLLTSGKRTFFFFSYEGLRLRLPVTTAFNVPSLRLRQTAAPAFQPILNAYPIPTGPEAFGIDPVFDTFGPLGYAPYQAAYSNPSSSDSYGIRIDHNLTNRITLFGRFSETPSESLTRTLSLLAGGRKNYRALTLGTTFAGKTFTNELRFNYTRDTGRFTTTIDNFGGAVPIDQSVLLGGNTPVGGVVQGSFSLPIARNIPRLEIGDAQDSRNRQINIVDNVSVIAGNHTVKFGVDYRRLMPTYGPVAYSYDTLVTFAFLVPLGLSFSQSIATKQGAEVRFNNYSFFGQDDWKATRRLTLSLGLRYELNPSPYDANGVEPIALTGINGTDVRGATLAPRGTPFFKTFKKAFAPRLGAAYQISDKPGRETVLRGGFGVYYDLGSSQSLNGFNTFPFTAIRSSDIGAPFPLPPGTLLPPTFSTVTLPISSIVYTNDPDLKLPYTFQYSVGVERSLGKNQAISVSYVGSASRRLLTNLTLNPRVGGQFLNRNFQQIIYTTNGPTSDYDSLQTQFTRRLTRGLQALVNYTWSHAIDEASDERSGELTRGNASFDVRHNFSAAVTYEVPKFSENRFVNAIAHGWAIDSTVYLQSGQPIDLIVGSIFTEDGRQFPVRPNYVAGQPFYIEQAGVPGGRRINPAAFVLPAVGTQGNLGRNVVRGPGIFQVNTGVRREFKLTERLRFQLRAEAFNLFNRPQFSQFNTDLSVTDFARFPTTAFGVPTQTLNASLGGINGLYQLGGPRSLQFSGRLFF